MECALIVASINLLIDNSTPKTDAYLTSAIDPSSEFIEGRLKLDVFLTGLE